MQKKIKKAFITGITGQDGSYLAEFLLDKGYEVHGLIRRSSYENKSRLQNILQSADTTRLRRFHLHYGDMTDSLSLTRILMEVNPDEIYNLAAQSHVKVSFEVPEYTAQADGVGILRLLEAIRMLGMSEKVKIYQASTSELYGDALEIPQSETTPFNPRSPYACAKLYSYWIIRNYREAYHMFAVNGILFNHESERRGEEFVTRKITLAAANIALGLQEKFSLGNLNSKRDWGYAKDYIECMWLMLQAKEPDDYVIATGETHTVREFCTIAFRQAGIELEWTGEGIQEKGINRENNRVVVEIDPAYFRPTEVELLQGDPSKAKRVLGWNPSSTPFDKLVEKMVKSDLEYIKNIRR